MALVYLAIGFWLAGCQPPQRQAFVQPACLLACQINQAPVQSDQPAQADSLTEYRVRK